MAAARSSSPVQEPDSASAIREFLRRAVALYGALLELHRHDGDRHSVQKEGPSVSDELLRAHAAQLGDSVRALKSAQAAAVGSDVPHPLTTVRDACCKVGQDLVLHIDRITGPEHESQQPEPAIDSPKLGNIWPIRDIAALGTRLQELSRRLHDGIDPPAFEALRLPLPDLNPSDQKRDESIDSRDAFQEGEEGEQQELEKGKGKMKRISIMPNENIYIEIPARPRVTPDSIVHDYLLDVLSYKSMHYREQEVAKAHSKTFEWVFRRSSSTNPHGGGEEGPEHRFSTWLRGDDLGPIYWITGKPGSGKSTFIRFLFEHESTTERLGVWSGDKPVFTAGFFFWTSGSREQRSQAGLLRSLLHQLLSAYPALAPSAFPQLWEKLKTLTTKERVALRLDWPVADLLEAFQGAMDAAASQMNICLFIDGLDEFEGDHAAMVEFFKNLCLGERGRSTKICLSSRPWTVFQDAFGYAVPNLRLQDLTYEDMYRYARDRLRENVYIRRLLKREAAAGEGLIQQAVRKSDGVFLWVRLALKETIRKFDQDAGLAGLSEALQALPSELNELFHLLFFDRQGEAELSEAAVIFGLMDAREVVADFIRNDAANALTVWELAFALRGSDDDGAAINQDAQQQAAAGMASERCQTTTNLIFSRFSGLLGVRARRESGNGRGLRFVDRSNDVSEAVDAAEQRVTYIHRTVRDWFMEEPGVMDRLVDKTPPDFDAHLRLLRSYVLQMKNPLEEVEHHRQLDEWWPGIALAMTHARHVQRDPRHLQRALVNEVDRTISWYWLSRPEDPYDHWARYGLGPYRMFKLAAPMWQPFLCLATRFGLTNYVMEEVTSRRAAEGGVSDEKKQLQTPESTPLLAYATEFLCSRNKTIFPLSESRLVEFLLRNPCRINPGTNHEYTDFWTRLPRTPWITMLRHLRDAWRRSWIEYYDVDPQGTARWAEIVRLFLEVGGADREAVVVKDSWDPEITATGVMGLLEATYGAVEMRELTEMMVRPREGLKRDDV
ncbi:hypothetical protein Trco_003283 [Trichoderma cornu-damae]|uniref:NACHT domain-containing protein n=1 Tax=Trichoderma cornu-damae TaxID=654480 RepID=A0A9P8TZD4_9HYPO|nr:hypothetical protein Trco_003283 [Trichoderma cornu-damae]